MITIKVSRPLFGDREGVVVIKVYLEGFWASHDAPFLDLGRG